MKQGGARCNSPIVCTALALILLGATSTILQKKHASELSQLQVSAEVASQAAEAKQAHMETETAAMHATILELKDQILRMQKKHAAEMSHLQVSCETAAQAANAKRALMEQQMLELKEQQRGHAATALYCFLTAPGFAVNIKTEDATFRLNKGALTVDGSFITEVHFVAETGRGEGELVHATFWANELNDYNTGMNMITGFCGKRPFFLAAGKTRSCGNLVIQVKHSSATFTTPEWQSTVRGNQVYDRLWGAKHRLDVSLRAIDGRMVAPGQTHGKRDIYPTEGRFRTSAMAEGAIEGSAEQYELPFGNTVNFAFSRFYSRRPADGLLLAAGEASAVDEGGEASVSVSSNANAAGSGRPRLVGMSHGSSWDPTHDFYPDRSIFVGNATHIECAPDDDYSEPAIVLAAGSAMGALLLFLMWLSSGLGRYSLASATGRFQANFGHAPDYVVVPGWIITVAFGALRLGGDIMWYGQDSAPTASKLNNLAIAVNAGEVRFWSAEDDTPFPSAFALREALVGFAAEHLDLDDPEGPLFVTSDNDRYDAGLEAYQADNLVTFNELTVDNLVGDDNTLGPWAFLNCLTPWSAEQPDEDDTSSEFMVVTGVMVKYAEKMDSELFELSAVDALANCLRAVARVPAALLPEDMTRTTRLKLMRFTLDMTQPERHRVIIKNNITTVLKSYPNLAKWTGAGPTAYGYILQLAAKVLEGQAFGFDVLPALDQKMVDFAGHYQQSWSPSNNIKYLCEQLSATPGAHGQTGAAPGGVPGGGLQGQESKMVQLLADIQEVHAEGGSGDDIIRTILASTCPRPIKWVLGVTKSTVGLPSGLLREEDAELPRRWADHLLDLIVGTDVAMKDLKIDAFSPAALEYLRSGKLSKKYINWDRDFICPILRHSAGEHLGETAVPIRDSAYQAMTTSQVLADSDRLATHLMYMPRILQSIGLLPKAENSYMSLLTFIQPKLAKARANGVLADGATNAAMLVDAAFDAAPCVFVRHTGDSAGA
ncbi:hypothetical protein EMIHUDRAFT_122056 [Emiliania huxleyi CCMP1516]|uniref:Uncharacterized protein n=2 Tax=Emiliania huxleyi TaxID=2903 RepID=A0A0D3KU68_EMIH1|nr:hypothetical protein EMIHUDRAFT_122056 [Emiliania huxleyi CCMP1516]EOD39303.1 hypothetical protein EMIHUDRAFT_122056 [Emiliania huxleyi CCMP1516]|eukprot:XP_005791732.1 hypothetical protein EMIHUDRAFT_122056 [Emiliania huxleyi CCMP1516]